MEPLVAFAKGFSACLTAGCETSVVLFIFCLTPTLLLKPARIGLFQKQGKLAHQSHPAWGARREAVAG